MLPNSFAPAPSADADPVLAEQASRAGLENMAKRIKAGQPLAWRVAPEGSLLGQEAPSGPKLGG